MASRKVVHIDQENDYEVTTIAKNFETFIRGLTGDLAEISVEGKDTDKILSLINEEFLNGEGFKVGRN